MTISLKVPGEVEAKLRSVAARKRISKSEYVRASLIAALSAEDDSPSAFDLVQDIAGSVSSGKKDMATNPKYMKGYGKWLR
jgi:Arc/MetJ-type ribon-helix-helix transcriptional regulator